MYQRGLIVFKYETGIAILETVPVSDGIAPYQYVPEYCDINLKYYITILNIYCNTDHSDIDDTIKYHIKIYWILTYKIIKLENVLYPMLKCVWGVLHTCHTFFYFSQNQKPYL